jgi:hypothetical protein
VRPIPGVPTVVNVHIIARTIQTYEPLGGNHLLYNRAAKLSPISVSASVVDAAAKTATTLVSAAFARPAPKYGKAIVAKAARQAARIFPLVLPWFLTAKAPVGAWGWYAQLPVEFERNETPPCFRKSPKTVVQFKTIGNLRAWPIASHI